MLKKYVLIFFLSASVNTFYGHRDSTQRVVTPHVNPALKFTENIGQWDDNILFKAQLDGGSLYMEDDCLTFDFYDKKKYRGIHHGGLAKGIYKDQTINCHAYKIHFEDCNPTPGIEKFEKGAEYENFFLGSDKNKWKGNVKNYRKVWYKNLYNQIDYEIITSVNGLKYNFHVKPGSDISRIKLRYEGLNEIEIKNGKLVYKLLVNEVTEQKPYAYQVINGKIVEVICNYKLKDNILSFDLPKGYNKKYPLVIDPTLVFAAQSGSTADNFGMTATYDAAGNFYTGGTAFGNGYPTTVGAYSITYTGPVAAGNTDVVITKYNPTGNALLFSTYIGGTSAEIVTSLVVDNNNNLCFYGATGSANFPITVGAYDNAFNGGLPLSFQYNGTTFNNGTDIYLGKFSSNGSTLLGSTYLGGSKNDGVNHVNNLSPLPGFPGVFEYLPDSLQHNYGDQYRGEIQVDPLNNIYISSSTRSSDFPVSVNAYDNSLGGQQDAIVAKFNTSLTQLLYSTYLGGGQNDCGNSLIVNNAQEVYITGGTCSSNFPTTAGAYSTSYFGGKADGYISHLSTTSNALLQSTFIGSSNNAGNNYDQSYIVQTDRANNIYVYGQSLGNMPVVPSGTFALYTNPGTHQFITRFNNTLSNINMATVFGSSTSSIDISPCAFSVDKCDNIYLSGWGGTILPPVVQISGMPLMNPTQNTTDGNDFYLMGLSGQAASLLYGSYFGGGTSDEHVDGGTSRFDPRGVIYQSVCAGCGGFDDFPVTPGAWPNTPGNPNHAGNCNNGVFKIDFQILLTVSTINTNTLSGCLPLTVSFTNATPGFSFKWYFGNGQTNTVSLNPVVTYTNPGTYTVSLVVLTPTNCNVKDSAVTFITIYPAPSTAFVSTLTPCLNTATFVNNTTGTLAANPYIWNFGDGSPTSTLTTPPPHTYSANGVYTISLITTAANGCTVSTTRTVSVFNFTPAITSNTLCEGQTKYVTASGGTSYTWNPGTSMSNSLVAAPAVNPTTTTIYTVQIDNNSAGFTCSKTLTTQVNVNPKPTSAFNYTANPCGGGVNFFDQSPPIIASWQWTLAPAVTSTVQNPYNFYNNGGSQTITLVVTNTFGCTDTSKVTTSVIVPPPLSINSSSQICLGNKAQLNATGGVSYTWSPAGSLNNANSANPIATPTTNTQYSVVITTSNNCNFLLTTGVGISLPLAVTPSAQANPVIVTTGNITTLTYLGAAGSTIVWYPLNSTTPATGYTVTANPDKPTTYTAVVITGACSEKTTVYVEAYTEGCLDKDVFIPNTFTPNSDGQNDILYVRGLKVDQVYFAIYNRWGELVFETTDKTKGWEGLYKGRPADVGVFGWYLKVKCLNGEESFKKGNVTLVR